jgi:hypothetical protein
LLAQWRVSASDIVEAVNHGFARISDENLVDAQGSAALLLVGGVGGSVDLADDATVVGLGRLGPAGSLEIEQAREIRLLAETCITLAPLFCCNGGAGHGARRVSGANRCGQPPRRSSAALAGVT